MSRPPLASGCIDAPHRLAEFGKFALESGESINELRISYVVHGSLDDRARPLIFGLCAIGSTHHRLDFLIGRGRALDPSLYTIIIIDALGNGLSSSPSNSPTQPGEQFPRFTISDMVNSQRLLASHLRIESVHAVIGASMGGMQVLQWGVSHPDFAERLVALVPMARTTPWSQAINHAGRLALANARDLATPEARWEAWVTVMNVLARSPSRLAADVLGASMNGAETDTVAWLKRCTRSVAADGRNPLDWIYQSHAYDAHDVGLSAGFDGNTQAALGSIRARTQIAVPWLDLYNPVEAGVWAARHIPGAELLRLPTDAGHLAASESAPASAALLNKEVGRFLRDEPPAR